MKITIVGAGAMGCLYGAKLSAAPDNDVYLLDVWQEHVDAINRNGLFMEEGDKELNYRDLRGVTHPEDAACADLAIIFVKSTLTETAVRENMAVFGPDTTALTLQNGLGNIDIISRIIGREKVIAGTTAHGATMLGPGRMRHAGSGKTIIGETDGSITSRIKETAKLLGEAGMDTGISDNVMGLVWDKLLVNVGINALTGLTQLKNGQLLDHPDITEIMNAAVDEAAEVARVKGIMLSNEDPAAHARQVAEATAENQSSMLQDILKGKKTEIDMINGAIVREGNETGVKTPVNRTLTALIRFMESCHSEK